MREFWYLMPYAALGALIIVYLAVRLALDWFDHLQRRRIKPYSQVYGGAFYVGNHRDNFRKVRP